MNKASLELMFRRIEQRDELSAEERAILEAAVDRTAVIEAGSDIVVEGDRPNRSTILLSGLATRYRVLRNGSRQLTSIHIPGDFVDLQSFPLRLMDHSVGALSE
jgi:CRP-like cAMP-binding protein